jgi:multidrug resistance efflux pump
LLLVLTAIAAPNLLLADDPKPPPMALETRGYLVPTSRVNVSPSVAGQVVEIMFDEGSHVKAGDVLARLDAREHEAALRLTRAKLKLAEAELTNAKTGKGDVAMAAARLDIARAEVEIAQLRLDGTIIRAPMGGTVLAKRAGVGSWVEPKTAIICELADLQMMEVEIWAPERDIARIKAGQACRIRVETLPDAMFEGVVARILPVADRARGAVGIRVRFNAGEASERLRPESSAIVQFLKRD